MLFSIRSNKKTNAHKRESKSAIRDLSSSSFKCRKPGRVTFTAWTLKHGRGQKCTYVIVINDNLKMCRSHSLCFHPGQVLSYVLIFSQFLFDNIVQNVFSRVPVSPTPVGRSWHTLTAVSDNTLFLFGGLSVDCKPMSKKMYPLLHFYFPCSFSHCMFFNCFLFNNTYFSHPGDGWVLDVETKKWREVEHPFKNKPR